jgi:hypothetical protein
MPVDTLMQPAQGLYFDAAPEQETTLKLKRQLMETQAENRQSQALMDWGWRILIAGMSAFMAYSQLQTTLAISQLELKIERQRIEDIQTRPTWKDLDRFEKQVEALKAQINASNGNTPNKR